MTPTTPTFTLPPGTADRLSGADPHELAKLAHRSLWYLSSTAQDDPAEHAAHYAFVHRIRAVTDADSWLLSFTVCPGDATAYRVVVGYDRLRSDAPWLAGLEPYGAAWLNVPVHMAGTTAVAEPPYVGYLVGHWPNVNATPGAFVAAAFASEVLAARARTLADHDARTARILDNLLATMATAPAMDEDDLRRIMSTLGNPDDPETEQADAERLISGEGR